jgi:hypothetical protein
MEIALGGDVGEAQWVATVALGLLHEEHIEFHKKPPAWKGVGFKIPK